MQKEENLYHLTNLTGLRAVAALYVLIFHIESRIGFDFLPGFVIDFIRQGALGVNLFFFLSGFILTYSYQHKIKNGITQQSYANFIAKRIARLYPAYVFCMLICILLSRYVPNFPETSLKIIALNVTMTQSYFPNYAMLWYGGGSWSISDEFFFYALFPFVLLMLLRIQSKKVLLVLAFLLCIVASIPGFLYNLNESLLSATFVYTFPPLRLSEFICGVVAGLLVFNHNLIIKPVFAFFAVLITSAYLVRFGHKLSMYVVHNLVALPAIFIIIVSMVAHGKAKIFNWLGSKTMVYLGKVSYSIYLIQLPIALVYDALLKGGQVNRGDYIHIIIWVVVNILGAILLYHSIEHPIYKRLHSLIDRKKTRLIVE